MAFWISSSRQPALPAWRVLDLCKLLLISALGCTKVGTMAQAEGIGDKKEGDGIFWDLTAWAQGSVSGNGGIYSWRAEIREVGGMNQ